MQGVTKISFVLLPDPFCVGDGTLSAELALRRAVIVTKYKDALSKPDGVLEV